MNNKKHPRDMDRVVRHLISFPVIWAQMIPLWLLDISITLYQGICFPLYGIPYIKRSNYICIDRYRLKYLTKWEKIHCTYCGYANGIMLYASMIVAETENYWCGVKHNKREGFVTPYHHKNFIKYGDAKAYASIKVVKK